MTLSRLLLIVAALGLVPIALSYGLVPEISMSLLYGIEVDGTSLTHILRAVMGLYLALATLWIFGAVIPELERPALISLVVFMFGLAAGRAASMVIDGFPGFLLVLYLGLELVMGAVGWKLLRTVSRTSGES